MISSASAHEMENSVAGLADGGWVVTWTEDLSGAKKVFQQKYGVDGTAIGAATLLHEPTNHYRTQSSTAALDNGGWIVTWADGDGASNYEIHQKRYDAAGAAIGGDVVVTGATAELKQDHVAVLDDGGWIVTWTEAGGDGNGYGIRQQHYDVNGVTIGAASTVNSFTAGEQSDSSVTSLSDGGWIVTWTSIGQDGDGAGIYMQRFNADGSVNGSEQRANITTAVVQETSDVVGLSDGGWVVAWSAWNGTTNDYDIVARQFDAAGVDVSHGEWTLSKTAIVNQYKPDLAALENGGFVATWEADGQDGSGLGVVQRYFLDAGGPSGDITGTAGNDVLNGTNAGEHIYGLAGADIIKALGGSDIVEGGTGSDRLSGGKASDTFVFHDAEGFDRVLDFDSTGGDHDVIDLSSLTSVVNFSQVRRHFVQHGDDLTIDFAGRNDILLVDTDSHDLGKGHFIF